MNISLLIFDYFMSILIKKFDISIFIFDYFKPFLIEKLILSLWIFPYLVTSFIILFAIFLVEALLIFNTVCSHK